MFEQVLDTQNETYLEKTQGSFTCIGFSQSFHTERETLQVNFSLWTFACSMLHHVKQSLS
jgi:hypothetical protein